MATAVDPNPSKTVDHKEHRTVKSVLKEFLEYSTAHGFGRLAASKGIYWKGFWVIAVIAIHITFWYHLIIIIRDYMNKPIATKVFMQRNKVLDFPVVTICNRNMVRQSKLTEEMKGELKRIRNRTSEYWKNYTHNKKNIRQHNTDSELLHFMHDRLESLRHMVSDIDSNKLREMGHQFEDMVIDCVFAGEDCREDKIENLWRHLWIDPVGNCYMFNRVLPQDNRKPHKTFLTGDQYGLRLLINIEQYEYIYGISPYAGLKVVIGPQGEMPFPLSEGINVGPGLSTSIELVMKQAKRLDPFKNDSCEAIGELEPTNIYHQYNMTYSKMACKMSCLSNMQKKRCKCSQFHYTDDPTIGYCKSSSNSTIRECLDKIKDNFETGVCEERCPPHCIDTDFSRTVSTYKWPANMYKDEFLESVQTIANISMKSTQEVSDNLLELHIYYADMDYELVQETLKYSFEDLISNIGGQLGMWIGMSVLTIAELFEVVWIGASVLINRRKRRPSCVSELPPLSSDSKETGIVISKF